MNRYTLIAVCTLCMLSGLVAFLVGYHVGYNALHDTVHTVQSYRTIEDPLDWLYDQFTCNITLSTSNWTEVKK
jgi:hypothetical protein